VADRIKLIFLLFQVSLLSETLSQPAVYTAVNSYYDDNIFNNESAVSDFINSFDLGLAYDFESENNNFELFYSGNLALYNENYTRSSHQHQFGAVNTFFIGEENPFNLGANYTFRKFKDDYELYNWDQLSAYANYRQSISDDEFLLFGYLFNRIKYENLDVFSFNEHKAFVKLKTTIATKNSFLFGVEGNLKNYINNLVEDESYDLTTQLRAFIQTAHSLGEGSGISFSLTATKIIDGNMRYLSSGEFIYYEEELINNIYSSEGLEGGAKFSQLLSPAVLIRLSGNYLFRVYPSLPAADMNGNSKNISREDNGFNFGAELEFSLGSFIEGLFSKAGYMRIINNSNDPFYEYSNNIFSLGLEFEY
jgi:hypothetical protein